MGNDGNGLMLVPDDGHAVPVVCLKRVSGDRLSGIPSHPVPRIDPPNARDSDTSNEFALGNEGGVAITGRHDGWLSPDALLQRAREAVKCIDDPLTRRIFTLKFGLESPREDIDEIARVCGISPACVQMLLTRALRNMPLVVEPTCEVPILAETAEWVCVAKPAGMRMTPFVRFAGGSVLNHVARHVCNQITRGVSEDWAPRPVHRVDDFTSGCVVFAKSSSAAARLQQLWQDGVEKCYLALLHGAIVDTTVTCSTPLTNHAGKTQSARTRVDILQRSSDKSVVLAKCTLLGTGRLHQIRRHCAELGLPLVADSRYGGWNIGAMTRPALHAWQLSIGDVTVRCPLPDDFVVFLGSVEGLQGWTPT